MGWGAHSSTEALAARYPAELDGAPAFMAAASAAITTLFQGHA
jgi:hypothetical protein